MPDYRRARIHGGTYFFTVKTEGNARIFHSSPAVEILGQVLRESQQRWPYEMSAIVLLPDHLHTIWSLPHGDTDYSTRWAWLKKEFTVRYLNAGGAERRTSESRMKNRRRGVWQRRFWEHVIKDNADFDAHFDYIHWNPVKHGYVTCPAQWPHSSFHRWVKRGVYERNWGCGQTPPPTITNLPQSMGE